MDSTNEKTKRKLNGFSIGCIVYLCVAIFMSVMYLLAAINNQLEVSDETMSPVASVITFSCFMIIPPLLWFIVLVCKKRLFFDINVERKIALQEYEDSDLKIINDYITEFSNNDKLIKIIKNYSQSHSVPVWELEFASLPLKKKLKIKLKENDTDLSFKLDKWIKYIDIDTNYIQFVKNIDQETLDENEHKINLIYQSRNLCAGGIFKEVYELYKSLINQNIFQLDKENDDEDCRYYAFLYLLYRSKKGNFYDEAVQRLGYYDVGENPSLDEIISKLFNNDVESGLIATTLWAINEKENNFNNLINKKYSFFEYITEQKVAELQEKQKIERLLDGNIQRVAYSISDIDLMSGEQFEHFVTYLFNSLGYKAINTKLSGDQGIDVIATKGKTKIAIQAKCYSKPVGNHAIMEAVAGGKYYNADKIMVVTNNTFTKGARELAQANNVILWDRSILKEKMEEI